MIDKQKQGKGAKYFFRPLNLLQARPGSTLDERVTWTSIEAHHNIGTSWENKLHQQDQAHVTNLQPLTKAGAKKKGLFNPQKTNKITTTLLLESTTENSTQIPQR